jgi:hypothetical protein
MDPLQLSLYNHGENLALGCERPLTQESLDCVVRDAVPSEPVSTCFYLLFHEKQVRRDHQRRLAPPKRLAFIEIPGITR